MEYSLFITSSVFNSRVRPVSGLVAADYFAVGYFVWAVLIANLAQIGYEEKTMYMAAYDWRLSFQNTEVRDQTLSRMKSNIELMVATNGGKKVVVIPHSMGVLYFLHFMKWVETPAPMGGAPKSVSELFSVEGRDIAVARAFAPGFLDKDVFGLQTFQHLMRMTRTWDSTMSMIPKGGDTIWGGLDWSPEGASFKCGAKRLRNNSINGMVQNANINLEDNVKSVNYGRIISFGKDVAEAHSSKIKRDDFQDAVKSVKLPNLTTNCDIWIEYHEIGNHRIKAVADNKVYTAGSILDLLHFVAPKLMAQGGAHFSLPNAPDMEIYSMYGVGIPTERAYVYKLNCSIPFQIDTSAEGGSEDSCLKGGVFSADGDETQGPPAKNWVEIMFTPISRNGLKGSTYSYSFHQHLRKVSTQSDNGDGAPSTAGHLAWELLLCDFSLNKPSSTLANVV
ncbi:Phospholipid:diacylglycerol acyltransferase 1 [Hibiscus syriacus]|uniref:Phospholipid:diacylglycerol acyltransferase 1 n=1 Tax=Hibiscus syriacus TaxID=106335 RepID=A0A6A2WHH8_HIBSY|nr:Phospholipid:diacylglycerol acyltransferase 1 [Hibiscus syriacus]